MKVITKDGVVQDNFALLLELTDIELAFIQEHRDQFFTTEWMAKLQKSKGNNAHIISLNIEDDVRVMKYLITLLDKYDSVSWYNRDHEFHIRRAICHHS
jgi:hypothetical protein